MKLKEKKTEFSLTYTSLIQLAGKSLEFKWKYDCSLGDIFMNPSLKELKFDLKLIDALDNKADAFYHQFLTKK